MQTRREYDRQRYLTKRKPLIFGDRKCRCCEIFLKGKYGADNSRVYCGNCIKNGSARRDQQRRHYRKYKDKIKAQVIEYQKTHKEYRTMYYNKWKNKVK